MANVFINLPSQAANGPGAWVDCSAQGAERDIVVGGATVATVTVEISNEAAPTQGAPVASFRCSGKGGGGQRVVTAAKWMRAVVTGYQSGGVPTINVGANDDGCTIANLAATAGDGTGAATDVSALPLTKTVTIGGPFKGSVLIEYSEDGTDYAPLTVMTRPGSITTRLAADFMRVERKGVPTIGPGLPLVDVGACEDSSTDPTFVDVVISDSLNDEGRFYLSGVASPAQITANQNNYAPAGLTTASQLRINSDAARNITGVVPGATPSGRRLTITNVGGFAITLQNENAGSTAANRFHFATGDLVLGIDASIDLEYDATTARWRAVNDRTQYAALAGGAASPAFRFNTEATGLYLNGAGVLAFAIAGTGLMTLGGGSLALFGGTSFVNSGAMFHQNTITPAALGANTNNYAPTGLATCETIRISASGAVDLTGIVAPTTDGQEIVLVNIGANVITLKDENAGSTAANRFALVADIALGQDFTAALRYDLTSARWRCIGKNVT